MTILILGATGATGRLLVEELLRRGHSVRAIARSRDRLPEALGQSDRLSITEAAVLDLEDAALNELADGCDAIASCLGHNLTLRGVYGQPRRLVTESVRRLCEAVKANAEKREGTAPKVKFVLMNSTGVRNRDLDERVSIAQRAVVGLIRLLVPPHADNEQAADFLRTEVGQTDRIIEWVAVRPDGLIDAEQVSDYDVHPSPTRSAIFDSGRTSRVNVAHFMADLIAEQNVWSKWRGQMPVIYNQT